jgi:hypothetical protein
VTIAQVYYRLPVSRANRKTHSKRGERFSMNAVMPSRHSGPSISNVVLLDGVMLDAPHLAQARGIMMSFQR